jgi:hypothetical protein
MRESLLPRRGGRHHPDPRPRGRPARLLVRLLLGGTAAALLFGLTRLFSGDSLQSERSVSATAAFSSSSAPLLPPIPRGGPDAGRGVDTDTRPWWVS